MYHIQLRDYRKDHSMHMKYIIKVGLLRRNGTDRAYS